ncbi:MAG: hypothetical protein ACI8W8_000540 [Rhodothermales bacterium]|jgi:hypothetical protein
MGRLSKALRPLIAKGRLDGADIVREWASSDWDRFVVSSQSEGREHWPAHIRQMWQAVAVVEALAGALHNTDLARNYVKAVLDAEERFMPSGPPMSPIMTSLFDSWASLDLAIGRDCETACSCVLDLAPQLRLRADLKPAVQALDRSRLGIYERLETKGENLWMRELLTEELHLCRCLSGYEGEPGQVWLTRVIPFAPRDEDAQPMLTTPYVASDYSADEWREFLREHVPQRGDLARNLARFMKRGPKPFYWFEYCMDGYCGHEDLAVFVKGLPGVVDSLPHASEKATPEPGFQGCSHPPEFDCPGLGKALCSSCCKRGRIVEIQCPATCPHNPFSPTNYDDRFMPIETRTMRKAVAYTQKHVTHGETQRMIEQLDVFGRGGTSAELFAHNFLLCVKRDHRGRTLAERWQAAKWKGLSGDEKLIADGFLKIRLRLLDVQRVRDAERVECVDLFDPDAGALNYCDRSFAEGAERFGTLLAWSVPTPCFDRLQGNADLVQPEVARELVAELSKLGKCAPGPELSRFATEQPRTVLSTWEGIQTARREAFLAAVPRHVRMRYAISMTIEALCHELLVHDDIARGLDEEGNRMMHWLRCGQSSDLPEPALACYKQRNGGEQVMLLADIKLQRRAFEVTAFSRDFADHIKRAFAKRLGSAIRLREEEEIDLTEQLAADPPDKADADLGPEPEIAAQMLANYMRDHYRSWVDESLPALQGQTPRQAAQDPRARALLTEVLKDHIHGLQSNPKIDHYALIDWLLTELDMRELR